MYSKINVLLWECWKITCWILIMSCILSLSGRLLYLTGFIGLEDSVVASKLTYFIGFSILSLFLFIGSSKPNDLKLTFPERLFRYPVSTQTLITVYMGYGIVAIAIQAFVFFGFEMLFFNSPNIRWSYFFIFETTFIILQTISWLSWIPGAMFHFIFCILSSISIYLSLYTFWDESISFSTGNIFLCLFIILICWAVSLMIVSTHRHNKWNFDRRWGDRYFTIFNRKPSRPFPSPMQAQIWLELRQIGHLFTIGFLSIIIPFIIIIPVYRVVMRIRYVDFPFSPISNIVAEYIFPLTILAALISGLFMFAVYQRHTDSGVSTFWIIRPLSTRKMAMARLNAIIISMARIFGAIILIILIFFISDWINGKVDLKTLTPVKWALKYDSPVEIITMTTIGLYGYLLFCWALLSMNAGVLTVGGLAILITGITKLFLGDTAAEYLINMMSVGVPLVLLFAFYIAKQRNLITTTTILTAGFIFPLIVVSLWAFPWFYSANGLPEGLPDLYFTQIVRLMCVAALSFYPLVLTPLIMDRMRHR